MKKFKLFYVLILAFLVCFSYFSAEARDVRSNSRNVWTNTNTFNQATEFIAGVTTNSNVEMKSTLEVEGQTTFNEGVIFNQEAAFKTITHTSGTSATGTPAFDTSGTTVVEIDMSDGNFVIINTTSGETAYKVVFPTITAALDGALLYIKNITTGTTMRVMLSTSSVTTHATEGGGSGGHNLTNSGSGLDARTLIEFDMGTATLTTGITTEIYSHAGNMGVWVADYVSDATNYWRFISGMTTVLP